MYKSRSSIGVFSAAMLGVGSMVGAGIFALLGQAAVTAGSAVWISFLASGVVALLSGASLARLGARYPAAGGIIEYLVQGWGRGRLSGSLSVLFYFAGIVGMSLVARAFGAYGAAWLPAPLRAHATPTLAAAVVVVLMLVNLNGARGVALVENTITGTKLAVLLLFGVAGLAYARASLLSPATWPAPESIFSTLGVTFFAFSGYSVITNTAEDMADPRRMLPRAIFLSISIVLAIYLLISFAVLGALPPERILAAEDHVLAEAARPVFGDWGFGLMTLTAMFSAASSLNANLYAVTNISYQMAKDGELPQEFGLPIAHSRRGLIISSVLVLSFAGTWNLVEIGSVGAVIVLLIQAVVHVGHLRLRAQTGANLLVLLLAALGTAGAAVFGLLYQAQQSPHTLVLLAALLAGAVAIEWAMFRRGRVVRSRTPAPTPTRQRTHPDEAHSAPASGR